MYLYEIVHEQGAYHISRGLGYLIDIVSQN